MAAPAIGVRKRWVPPEAAMVDWSHPIATGLQAFVIPSQVRDAAGRWPVTAVGALTRSPTGAGQGVAGWNNSPEAHLLIGANGQSLLGGSPQYTIVAGIHNIGLTANTGPIYCERSGSSNEICKFEYASSTHLYGVHRDTAGNICDYEPGNTPAAGFVTGAAVRRNTTDFEVWENGLRTATDSTGSMTTAFSPSGIECRIGNDLGDLAGALIGGVAYVALWTRALSAAELGSMVGDPFQMLRW